VKLHVIEAIGSILVVGLGQIIKGESKKGLGLMLSFYFVIPAIVYVPLMFKSYLFIYLFGFSIISGIILWVYSVGDALLKKKQQVKQEHGRKK
jgi:hypothetical protein